MSLNISSGVLVAALALGAGGALVGFDLGGGNTAEPEPAAPTSSAAPSAKAEGQQRRPVRLAPCRKPAVLEKGVCVTDEVRTVVVPAPSGTPSSGTAPARQDLSARDDDTADVTEVEDDGDDRADGDDTRLTGTHTRTRSHQTRTRTRTQTRTRGDD